MNDEEFGNQIDFEILSELLSEAYDESYHIDREEGLRKFGSEHCAALRRALDAGYTLDDLAQAAGLNPPEFWARRIQEGMD